MAIQSETTFSDRPCGKEWDYRVVAMNEAGEGLARNAVMAVFSSWDGFDFAFLVVLAGGLATTVAVI